MKVTSLAADLINISSLSGNEEAVFSFTKQWFEANNFDFSIQEDLFVAGRKFAKKHDKAVILSGHLDTVTAGDKSLWSTSPTKANLQDGRLMGLGASDMKSAVAAQMLAVAEIRSAEYDLWVVAVGNEELDGSGSEAFMQWFEAEYDYKQAVCVIGEPTDLDRIEIGHRGNRFVSVRFSGLSGHASQQASFSESSLFAANVFLSNIDKIAKSLAGNYSDDLMGSPSIVPTVISAGDADSPNKAAAITDIILDIRTTPQLDEDFDSWFKQLAKEYNFEYNYVVPPVASSLCDKNSLLIKNMISSSGIDNISISKGATDQISFQSRGNDTVVFGPGEFSQAHKVDEFIYVDKLSHYKKILERFLTEFKF